MRNTKTESTTPEANYDKHLYTCQRQSTTNTTLPWRHAKKHDRRWNTHETREKTKASDELRESVVTTTLSTNTSCGLRTSTTPDAVVAHEEHGIKKKKKHKVTPTTSSPKKVQYLPTG